ncbi:heme-binding protein soul2 [Salvelinus namaycush]|uniref:Heme-binding protein soul2 n=1 Tax=Salvelinus namaycush TaxID=8040 RepID=A0A8U0P1Y0_SALNM|nr:heme-binding protein soul2 [Salvelinus namaycush]
MKYLEVTTLLSVLAVVFLRGAHGWDAPPFCHSYDCPEFTVVNKYEDFEERAYQVSRWITVDSLGVSDHDVKAGFTKLWDYTQWDNQAGEHVNTHTWPALISTTEVEDGGEKHASLSFYVAPEDTVLPTPNDASIRNETMPACTIYVRTFSGFLSEYNFQENLKKLRDALTQAGKAFDSHRFIAAGYEGPWTLIGRHNEVWIHAA